MKKIMLMAVLFGATACGIKGDLRPVERDVEQDVEQVSPKSVQK